MERRKFIKLGTTAVFAVPLVFRRNFPLFVSTSPSQIVTVFDNSASFLKITPGKKPNANGEVTDRVLSFAMNRDRIYSMVNTAVMNITGRSSIGKAWESLFPAGHPNTNTTVSIKLNFSYGGHIGENDWNSVYCPFGAKSILSDAIVSGLTQMMDGHFPVENITMFDVSYSAELRKGYSLVQGYRPVPTNADGINKCNLPGTYRIHWVNPGNTVEIPSIAPGFIAAHDFPDKYKAPQRILPPAYESDFMINVAIAKNHREAGITGVMKNTYGCTDNPLGTHGNEWNLENTPYAGTPLCIPVFYKNINKHSPCILHILDALSGVYHGGPLAGKIFHANTIAISRDPVATDTYLLSIINRFRHQNGYAILSIEDGKSQDGHPNAPFLRFASELHGLGSMSMDGFCFHDLSKNRSLREIPVLDRSQSHVSDVTKTQYNYQLNIFLDNSGRMRRIESRIEDINGKIIKNEPIQSTRSSHIILQWNQRDNYRIPVGEGIYVWHVTVDGMMHTRIINPKNS